MFLATLLLGVNVPIHTQERAHAVLVEMDLSVYPDKINVVEIVLVAKNPKHAVRKLQRMELLVNAYNKEYVAMVELHELIHVLQI